MRSHLVKHHLEGYSGQFLTMRYEYRMHTPAPHNPNKLGLVFGVYHLGIRRGEVFVFTDVLAGSIRQPNKKGKNPRFTPIENRGIWNTLALNELLPKTQPSRFWRYFDKIMKGGEWVGKVKGRKLQSTMVFRVSTRDLWRVDRAPEKYISSAYQQMHMWFHGYDPFECSPPRAHEDTVPF